MRAESENLVGGGVLEPVLVGGGVGVSELVVLVGSVNMQLTSKTSPPLIHSLTHSQGGSWQRTTRLLVKV